MGAIRGASVLASFLALTLPLMPVQALLVRSGSKRARTFPHWYHRQVCRLLGIRLHIEGEVDPQRPVLLIANHSTWLDIPVLSAVAPLSFVAKREVSTWPFVSSLARLQRTVFVDRTRRTAVGQTAGEITQRLSAGDTIVLFAEGTSSDGNRVLPFMTSLFAAAKPAARDAAVAGDAGGEQAEQAVVQTLSAVYTHLHGIPVGREGRPRIAWYGDMEMRSHAWELLKAGPLDVTIRVSAPVPLTSFADRKELARHSEAQVREGVVRILRGRPADEPVAVVAPESAQSAVRSRLADQAGQDGRKWT
ncbi:lysophospholipid acyltransferase family protein [Hyphomicrobium sp. D-2]|uniref:lysophospholipid acyltransferase family protein n=1 Tax=Hyphomicrobium sp. D-2 TaxID=3041621 RepID=UPI002453B6BF|nr:lysophospholipid acyltransferase family protein [Hyphomicrobium sp. D-2]MDH4983126.1 lysophospholipid acyltransferase family protein [Hyphomicrobium sp. D-2]